MIRSQPQEQFPALMPVEQLERIDIESKNMTDTDQLLIQNVYSMYMQEPNQAQKQHYKKQITDYLDQRGIKYSFVAVPVDPTQQLH
mmetsp:Transcript_37483/g.57399  ORF Transcript_37483/g.57399 Transcript_37483/m.57399 type:complete len:86 (+) Transcript_37483:4328-4585(+)